MQKLNKFGYIKKMSGFRVPSIFCRKNTLLFAQFKYLLYRRGHRHQIFVVSSDAALLRNSPENTVAQLCEKQGFEAKNINKFAFYCSKPCLFQIFVVSLQRIWKIGFLWN